MFRLIVASACCIAYFNKASWISEEIMIYVSSTILIFSIYGFVNEVWKKIRVSFMKFSKLILYMISFLWYKDYRGSHQAYKKRRRRRQKVNYHYLTKKSSDEISVGSLEGAEKETSDHLNSNSTVLSRKLIPDKGENKIPENEKYGRKKRKWKQRPCNIDDSTKQYLVQVSAASSKNYSTSESHVKKSKVYTPLELYLILDLDLCNIYKKFEAFLLTNDQLKLYGFPMQFSDHPDRIISDQHLIKTSMERRCCRCKNQFYISADGMYEAQNFCQYHPRKPLPYIKGCPFTGQFPCCNGDYKSTGCLTSQYHVSTGSFLHDVDFVKTRSKKHLNEVTASTIYAIDCEMIYTTAGMEVAKVGIVGVDGLTVFESFVLPQNDVLDYNTAYSGVTEKDLKGISTTFVDIQTYLLKLLNKDTILVGHGIENDLKVLRLIHGKVVDTSVAFLLPQEIYKKSLKNLAKEFLNRNIQQSLDGHDPTEDARTCMELMLYKISTDLKERIPCTQDENKEWFLPKKPQHHPQLPVQNYIHLKPPQEPVQKYLSSGEAQAPVQSYHYFEEPREVLYNNFYSDRQQSHLQIHQYSKQPQDHLQYSKQPRQNLVQESMITERCRASAQKKCNSPFCNGLEGILHSHSFLHLLKKKD